MASTTDKLIGAYVKLERAEQHFFDLVALVQSFKESDPYNVVSEDDPQTGKKVSLFRQRQPIRLAIPLRTGEVIQNLRTALDYLACELVADRGGWKNVTNETRFPYFGSANEYKAVRKGIKKSMGKPAVLLFDKIHPYKGGNDPLWQLCKLNNIEKHRTLIMTGIAYQIFDPGAVPGLASLPFTLGAPSRWFTPGDSIFPLEDGTPLPPLIGARSQVDVKEKFTFEIAFHESKVMQREGIIETLQKFRSLALNILEEFAPILGSAGPVAWLNRPLPRL